MLKKHCSAFSHYTYNSSFCISKISSLECINIRSTFGSYIPLLLNQKMANTRVTPDQMHCGDVLISRKRAVNGDLFLLFGRGRSRLCVFQNKWENSNNAGSIYQPGILTNFLMKKNFNPEVLHGNHIVWITITNGFKFFIGQNAYQEIMNKTDMVDNMLQHEIAEEAGFLRQVVILG